MLINSTSASCYVTLLMFVSLWQSDEATLLGDIGKHVNKHHVIKQSNYSLTDSTTAATPEADIATPLMQMMVQLLLVE